MIGRILRAVRALLSDDPEPVDRLYIRTDGAVEPYMEDEHGRHLRPIIPGSREDPFSVLHLNDPAALTQRAMYHLARKEYEDVGSVLYQLAVHLNKEASQQEERL